MLEILLIVLAIWLIFGGPWVPYARWGYRPYGGGVLVILVIIILVILLSGGIHVRYV